MDEFTSEIEPEDNRDAVRRSLHEDLQRLRALPAEPTRAEYVEQLRRDLSAMTVEKGEYQRHAEFLRVQLDTARADILAREMREAALATPPSTALAEALAAERERCCAILEDEFSRLDEYDGSAFYVVEGALARMRELRTLPAEPTRAEEARER